MAWIDCAGGRAGTNAKIALSRFFLLVRMSGCMRPKQATRIVRHREEHAACYCCSKSLVIANEAVNYGRHVTAMRPGPTFQFIASLAQRSQS